MKRMILTVLAVLALAGGAIGATNTSTWDNTSYSYFSVTNRYGNAGVGTVQWVKVSLQVPVMSNVTVLVTNNHLLIKPYDIKEHVSYTYTNTFAGGVVAVAITNPAHAYVSCTGTVFECYKFTTRGAPYFWVAVTNATLTRFAVDVNAE